MSNPYLLADDSPDGKDGVVWLNYDGKLSEIIGASKVEAKDNIETTDFKTIGTRKTQVKVKAVSGKGSMELDYSAVSVFSDMVHRYKKTGKLPVFSLTVENNDMTTGLGKRIVRYTGCVLDGEVVSSLLDAGADDGMKITVNFKYSDSEVLQDFAAPSNIGRD